MEKQYTIAKQWIKLLAEMQPSFRNNEPQVTYTELFSGSLQVSVYFSPKDLYDSGANYNLFFGKKGGVKTMTKKHKLARISAVYQAVNTFA